MKKIWTVAFCERSFDYSGVDIIGLFSSEDKAVSFAEKHINEFMKPKEGKRAKLWSEPVKEVKRFNGANRTSFTTKDGCLTVEVVASLQDYSSDEDV